MPEQLSIEDFLRESWEDYNSPTTSNFVAQMAQCRGTVAGIEETLDGDRSGLTKMKKSIKALHSSGNTQVNHESYLAENLERLGSSALVRDNEVEIGAAFLKFAVVTKELSALMKNLMQNVSNILMFPLDSFLKGDLRGVKGDLKKPFDKAWKDYENKFNKIEKEKKQLAKDAGLIRSEVTGPEIAEEMEKERRVFQLQMCEYLIKVNEIKTRKGVDLLQHLVEYYQAQNNYFQDGLKTIEHFKTYIEELVAQLSKIKQRQDHERRHLVELRDALKSTITSYKESTSGASGYNLHQLQGNKAYGYEKRGYLLKKSEGKMRKVWQRRKCIIKDGILSISHSDTTKEPVKLNLLTCQVKFIPEDPGKKCFDLISSSKSRTYHFQADESKEMEAWISVLNNAKEAVFRQAVGSSTGLDSSPINQSVKELTQTIINEVKRLPGNRNCCDCNAPDPEWLSVNLGVLICLECCGVHREMGVHISRTQSIVIDDLGTSQLLLARSVGNRLFNEIMEATLDTKYKPLPNSEMDDKKTFIRAKYEKRRYAIVTCTDLDDRKQDLKQAVLARDLSALLQVFAEGIDFMEPLPEMDNDDTALHLAILQEDGSSLHMVDFIIQNSTGQSLRRATKDGNTVLHISSQENRTECMKLLLRVQPDLVNYENKEGQTPLEIARDYNNDVCVELLNHAISGKTILFDNVNVDWHLIQEDHLMDAVDYSDDDLDGTHTPDRRARSRPGSLVLPSDTSQVHPMSHRERSHTADSLKFATLPPPPLPPPNKPKGLQVPARGHTRSPSDPPPLPAKVMMNPGFRPSLAPGVKMVLPPPPEFLAPGDQAPTAGVKPIPAARPNHKGSTSSDTSTPELRKSSSTASQPESLSDMNDRSHSSDRGLDSSGSNSSMDILEGPRRPVPRPRRDRPGMRCKAIFNCEADNEDELSFVIGEVIVVEREEEEEWWEGYIEGQPHRRGVFPTTFVSPIRE